MYQINIMLKYAVCILLLIGAAQSSPTQKVKCLPGLQEQNVKEIQQVIERMYDVYKPKNAPNPQQLAPKLHKAWLEHHIHPETVLRIMAHESRFDALAVNRRTHDYGLMQINGHTAKSMHINKNCLMQWECNLDVAIIVLIGFKKQYKTSENWVCRYNVGTRALHGKRLVACNRYISKIEDIKLARGD